MDPPSCCRGTRVQRQRDVVPCRSVCAVGFSVAVASSLPAAPHAALSISSGYEQFLTHIRRRIVCEKEDIFDEAEQRGWAQPCDSMRDGPFCRGLPKLGPATSRHRPFTVDSIIPHHLFGDPRLSKELRKMHETSSVGTELNKQAMNTLNQFLEDFYNPKEALPRVTAVEGRLEFQHAPLWRTANLEPTFSRGLPPGVVAGWRGAWQVLPCPVEAQHRAGGSRKEASDLPRFVASARLNGAIGTLSFSRPVIVRHLVVRPPLHAAEGRHQLLVRARKKGREAWRAEYDYDAAVGPAQPPVCAVGDVVHGQRVANGPRAMAVLLAVHSTSATVRWLEKADHTHRFLSWKHITTMDGMPCSSSTAPFVASADSSRNRRPTPWRDVARRMKSVDEISFLVPIGTEGWLIKDVVAATVQWSPPTADAVSKDADGDGGGAHPGDPTAHMVQVLPGSQAIIVEASRAAVMYHADDMLEQGLQVRSSRPTPRTGAGVDDVLSAGGGDEEGGTEPSSRVQLNPARSVEGLQQLLLALGDLGDGPSARLPPHVGPDQLLRDLERLAGSLDLSKAGRLVNQFGHFEALVAYHWDWFTPSDAVDVAFEHWRRSGKAQAEAAGAFFEGQEWLGSYLCTQGPTALTLNVTQVSSRHGRDYVTADLTFMIDNEDSHVRGVYEVSGQVEPAGRTAVFEPVPGSWKTKPQNFVMVGLQGVVSRAVDAGNELRFAGYVPIFGCDSFELRARADKQSPLSLAARPKKGAPGGAVHVDQQTSLWNSALSRYIHALNEARQRWRVGLRQVILEKEASNKNLTSQVAKLVQAAKDAGVLSFDLKTSEGGEIVVELGGR